jgi:hypothetical protein
MERNSIGIEKYQCRRCAKPLDYRIPRQQIVKTILFWVPLKRYKCTSCEKKQYVVVKK